MPHNNVMDLVVTVAVLPQLVKIGGTNATEP
jgi:hypothetical protein